MFNTWKNVFLGKQGSFFPCPYSPADEVDNNSTTEDAIKNIHDIMKHIFLIFFSPGYTTNLTLFHEDEARARHFEMCKHKQVIYSLSTLVNC